MEELLQILKDANHARRIGMSQADIDAEVARLTQGQIPSHQALSVAVREQATNPSLVAQRRQAEMAQAVSPDVNNPAPQMIPGVPGVTPTLTLPGMTRGLPEQFGKGAGVNLTEEAGGLLEMLRHPLTRGAFQQGREHAMARNTAYQTEHPIAAGATQIAGGLAAMPLQSRVFAAPIAGMEKLLGVEKVAEGATPSLWNLARQGMAAGVPIGATYAAADAPTLGDAPKQFALGGLTGGAIGGTAGLAVPALMGVGKGVQRAAQNFFDPATAAQEQALQRLGMVINPSYAKGPLQEAETFAPGQARLGDANPQAYGVVMRRTPEGQATAAALQARADMGGPRLANDLESLARGTGMNPDALARSAEARTAASELRAKTYTPIEETHSALSLSDSPAINGAWGSPEVQEVAKKVLRGQMPTAADPVVPFFGKKWSQLTPAQQQAAVASGVQPPGQATIPFKALQEIENELFVRAENAHTGANFTREQYGNAAQELRTAMRQDIPGLTEADDQWSRLLTVYGPSKTHGNSGLLGQFAEGSHALGKPVSVVQQELDRLATNPEAQNAYRAGMLWEHGQQLRGLRSGVDAARVATTEGSQNIDEHLRIAFGDQKAIDTFLRSAKVQKLFRQSASEFGGGSPTQSRQSLASTLFPNEGAKRGMVQRVLDQFRSGAVTVPDDQLTRAYEGIVNSQGPEMFSNLNAIQQAQRQAAQYGPQAQRIAKAAGMVAGGPAQQPIGYAELLALLGLAQGAKKATRLVTGATNDRGY